MILLGVFTYFVVHFILNVGGVSAIIPLTGVPLLLISSGGSSLVASMLGLGLAQDELMRNKERENELWSYNLETILGEKLQTILVRERANTRMRDFYDICVLVEMYAGKIKVEDFRAAYEATCRKRESVHLIKKEEEIIDIIKSDSKLNEQWINYQKKNQSSKCSRKQKKNKSKGKSESLNFPNHSLTSCIMYQAK